MQIRKKAFTLLELLVAIAILAILGIIAFISFQGYSSNSRDSVRSSDLRLITNSLQIFQVNSGKLPQTNSGTNITYSGGLVAWTQGTFSENQRIQTDNLNKTPVDPLTEKEYTYSVTNMGNEFELGAAYESSLVENEYLVTKTYASSKIRGISRVTGNYNGVLLAIKEGDNYYLLAVPTIINGDLTWDSIENILLNKTLSTDGGPTLPSSYTGTKFDTSKINDTYNPDIDKILVYSGSLSTLTSSGGEIAIVLEKIQEAYSGTTIGTTDPTIQNLLTTILNPSNPTSGVVTIGKSIIGNSTGIKSSSMIASTALTVCCIV